MMGCPLFWLRICGGSGPLDSDFSPGSGEQQGTRQPKFSPPFRSFHKRQSGSGSPFRDPNPQPIEAVPNELGPNRPGDREERRPLNPDFSRVFGSPKSGEVGCQKPANGLISIATEAGKTNQRLRRAGMHTF